MKRWIWDIYTIGLSLAFLGGFILPVQAADTTLPVVRVGTLKFGTVNWQINVIKHHGLDKKHGFALKLIPLASKNAAAVAIQGNGADIVVSDWFWVSRQRNNKRNYAFAPYSTAAGGVIVAKDSPIKSLSDLEGKAVGIAGGRVDKSWLILRTYARHQGLGDMDDKVRTVYGAPPLLSKIFERGEVDAVLTFWHYGARLQSQGFRSILSVHTMLEAMDITPDIPINGWVFHQDWAEQNPAVIAGFLAASREAATIMDSSNAEWDRLAQSVMTDLDRQALDALRSSYRAGIVRQFTAKQIISASNLYRLFQGLGGQALVGSNESLATGTFWPPSRTDYIP